VAVPARTPRGEPGPVRLRVGPPAVTGRALHRRATIPRDVVFRDLDGEAVLLDLKTGVYFGLDPIGTRIWLLLHERRRLAEVRDVLVGEYDVTAEVLGDDLLRFVGELAAEGLLELGDD
jgi:coenzyme PQQ synthesis protein D (PqqD)